MILQMDIRTDDWTDRYNNIRTFSWKSVGIMNSPEDLLRRNI